MSSSEPTRLTPAEIDELLLRGNEPYAPVTIKKVLPTEARGVRVLRVLGFWNKVGKTPPCFSFASYLNGYQVAAPVHCFQKETTAVLALTSAFALSLYQEELAEIFPIFDDEV